MNFSLLNCSESLARVEGGEMDRDAEFLGHLDAHYVARYEDYR